MALSRLTSRLPWICKIIAINGAVFILILLLLEGAVRVLAPEVQPLGEDSRLFVDRLYGNSHGYMPNARGRSLDAEFVTGPRGRRIVPDEPISAAENKILFIGDSIAVGFGVEAENALPHILDRELENYEVVNAAVTAYTAIDYANKLAALLPVIKPEGVIVAFCLNDFNSDYTFEVPSPRGQERDRSATPVPGWLRYINDNIFDFNHVLRRHSRLYVWTKNLVFDNSANVFRADRKLYLRPDAHSRIIEDISRLEELAREHDAWIEFFIFPYEYQLRSPAHPDVLPQQVIKNAADDAGTHIHDLHTAMADYLGVSGTSSKSLYLFSDPMHFSPAGHDLLTRVVRKSIEHRLNTSTQRASASPTSAQAHHHSGKCNHQRDHDDL